MVNDGTADEGLLPAPPAGMEDPSAPEKDEESAQLEEEGLSIGNDNID